MATHRQRARIREEPEPKDNLFGWTVFILLLIGASFAVWIGSYYVFGRPELPKSYEILGKLGKREAPKRFAVTKAPSGEFLNADRLLERYLTMSRLDLESENAGFMRAYITNYSAVKRLVPYVIGRFHVMAVRELGADDLMPSGMAALARSADRPEVVIEHLFPCAPETVPTLRRYIREGLEFKIERSVDLSSILHVRRPETGGLQITCVPLTYGSYQMGQGEGRFDLEPPPWLNLVAGAPIWKGEDFAQIVSSSSPRRTTRPRPGATPDPDVAGPTLVRAEPPPGPTPKPTATPVVAAVAVATPTSVPVAAPRTTPTPVQVAAAATPRLVSTPGASPLPSPAALAAASPARVALQPFLQAVATPPAASTQRTWKTYQPGRMPLGRLLDVEESARLAETGIGGEPVYLRGEFSVTATDGNRAVMRPRGGGGRIIAEFPAGFAPPGQGERLGRDAQRPFQITDVRRGADGQINIYVREIVPQP